MTVGDIKKAVRFYLQQSAASLTFEGLDMVLHEINAARRNMCQLHDFVAEEDTAEVMVDPDDGGQLYDDDDVTQSGGLVKGARRFYLVTSQGDHIPLLHYEKDIVSIRTIQKETHWTWDYNDRYQGDGSEVVGIAHRPVVYIYGGKIYLNPRPEVETEIHADVYVHLPDYTGDDDEDWFTNNATNYLKWQTIINLNPRTGTFVERPEGTPTLRSIIALRDEAWESAKKMDLYLKETGRFPFA